MIPGLTAYNSLVPTILIAADAYKVPPKIVALVVLTESAGKSGERYEPGFQKRYVDPLFDKWKKKEKGYGLHMVLEKMFKNQLEQGLVKDKDEFKKRLATQYGPSQMIYLTAIDRFGFRGTGEELAQPETNIAYATRMIAKQGNKTEFLPEKVLTAYNCGSVNGTPTKGHIGRGMHFWTMLEKNK